MADNSKVTPGVIDVSKNELQRRLEAVKDKANWEWVEIPATDLFGDTHTGVSINFVKYEPEKDANGNFTGNPQKYFVDPEIASEIRRLLETRLRGDMRVLQPTQDKKMFEIMRKGGRAVPDLRG